MNTPTHRVSVHPGEILLHEYLEPLELSQAEFARALRIPLNRVNEIVKGKRGITAETALLFADYFKTSPEVWMNLQMAHDLSKARLTHKKLNVGVSRRRHRTVA
jgi:addiction module HigA family antidote